MPISTRNPSPARPATRPAPARAKKNKGPGKPGAKPKAKRPAAPDRRKGAQAKRPAGQAPQGRPAAPAKPGPQGEPSLLEKFTGKVQDGFRAVNERLNPPLTGGQRKAAQTMHDMLAPNKLGGNDRTFNHADVDAVVKGLTDKGIKGMIAKRVVASQLPQGLDEAGVKRDPQAKPDTRARQVSSDELRAFQKAGEVLEKRSEDLQKLGLKATFPGGISQDAISHMLEGRFGLPPGIEIVPAQPWPKQ